MEKTEALEENIQSNLNSLIGTTLEEDQKWKKT